MGTADAPLVVPAGSVVVPGSRGRSTGSFAADARPGRDDRALVKDRDAGTDARVALEAALR